MNTRLAVPMLAILFAACHSADNFSPPVVSPAAAVNVVPPTSTSLAVGDSVILTAQVIDGRGTVLSGRVLTWTSSDPSQATVVAGDALGSLAIVTGMGPGTATITATSEGKSGAVSLTILGSAAALILSPAEVAIPMGGAAQLTVRLQDAAGNILTAERIVFTSSDETIATVSSAGMITAVAPGSAAITATGQGVSGRAMVTVAAP